MRRVELGDKEGFDLEKDEALSCPATLDADAIRARLKQDPGDPTFADLAQLLRKEKKYEEARSVCYQGLSSNPAAHRGRLVLAWIYYDEEYFPFAIREILALRNTFPESDVVLKLLTALGGSGTLGSDNTLVGSGIFKDTDTLKDSYSEHIGDIQNIADDESSSRAEYNSNSRDESDKNIEGDSLSSATKLVAPVEAKSLNNKVTSNNRSELANSATVVAEAEIDLDELF